MAYVLLGIYLLFVGLLLLGGNAGQLHGAKVFIDFGEYKDVAGVVFLAASFLAFRRGLRGRQMQDFRDRF